MMKMSLFTILLTLFEKSLSQLKNSLIEQNKQSDDAGMDVIAEAIESLKQEVSSDPADNQYLHLKDARSSSTRIFTKQETIKLTKASYQLLMRLYAWKILSLENLEQILNEIIHSDSRIISLKETKWIIKNTISKEENKNIPLLNLVLYQKEQGQKLH